MLILLAKMSVAYRVLPHEILDLPADEFSLALLCYMELEAVAGDVAKNIVAGGGVVIPTINLGL